MYTTEGWGRPKQAPTVTLYPVRLNESMPYIFAILTGANNTQYIAILRGMCQQARLNVLSILADPQAPSPVLTHDRETA